MEYAVIETGGKQYRVSPGATLAVDHLKQEDSASFSFDKVLLHVKDGNVILGKPYIAGLVVNAKILESYKGKKVRVAKFLAKSRYRKVRGFRSLLSRVEIGEILGSSTSSTRRTKADASTSLSKKASE